MRTVVCDIETNSLDAVVIWCVVAFDVDTKEEFVFLQGDADKFREFCSEVDTFIGHNFLCFDAPTLNRLWGTSIRTDQVVDTLVLSRLFNACSEWTNTATGKRSVKQTRNKHSLDSWGETLGFPKLDFKAFSTYSEEMLTYCKQDVQLNYKVYQQLLKEGEGFSKESIRIEHETVRILNKQQKNGFKIDLPKAKNLLARCADRASEIEAQIQTDFKPLPKKGREYTPRINKDGTSHAKNTLGPLQDVYGVNYHGEPYTSFTWEAFNLSSPAQVVARLAGHWNPVEFTPAKQPKLSDKNLATIKDTAPDSIKNIKLYRMLTSRCNELKQWTTNADSHVDGRLRGRVTHLGSWSGRMSHDKPNTANIAGVNYDEEGNVLLGEKGNFGYEMRSLWTVEDGYKLVGCDAAGIQLRVLAHYINNPEYTEAVLTDIHTFNANTLGCSRPVAKTFIYSWLLGAGVAKTAEILNCTTGEAQHQRERFVKLTPGLEQFLKKKTLYAERGHYYGLDGRKVYLPSDHLALTAFLQNGECVIMKVANMYWDKWATEKGLDFKQCGVVHDEYQVEVRADQADELGNLMVKSFKQAAHYLKLRVPMDGEYIVGNHWGETH